MYATRKPVQDIAVAILRFTYLFLFWPWVLYSVDYFPISVRSGVPSNVGCRILGGLWYMGDTLKLGSPSLVSILHLRVVVYSSTFRSLGLTSPSTKVEVAYILLKNKVWVDTPKCVLLIASSPFRRYYSWCQSLVILFYLPVANPTSKRDLNQRILFETRETFLN